MNIGIITQEGELVVPPFEHALAGCTLKRLLHLVQEVSSAVSWALPLLWLTFKVQQRKKVRASAKVMLSQTLAIGLCSSFNMLM